MKALLLNVCLLLFVLTSPAVANPEPAAQPPGPHTAPLAEQQPAAAEPPQGLAASDWADIQAQISARQYHAFTQDDGSYASSNTAHGWTIRHAADGTTTVQPLDPESPPYQVGFRLEAVGYGEPQRLNAPPKLSADDTTVTYQWTPDLREWWTNAEVGLEQWFELERRPADAIAGQPLQLQLSLDGDLSPHLLGDTLVLTGTGGTKLTFSKLVAWDATGRELAAHMELAANGLNLLIEDQDARYPLTIDPTLEQQAYLKGSNTAAASRIGASVSLDGDTLAVGAWGENSQTGAVYVFVRSGTVWSQQARLTASNPNTIDNFGISVALEGETLVVGSRYEDGSAADPGDVAGFTRSGAAYVFTRSGTVWTERVRLKASNAGQFDQFGDSVALSGGTLVVGASGEASSETGAHATGVGNEGNALGFSLSGAAYVFTGSGASWTQEAYLKASNTGGSDQFGASVAIDGDIIVVGAREEDGDATGVDGADNNNGLDTGAAYVFTRTGGVWSFPVYLKAFNTDDEDEFGYAVAVDGNTVVVGAWAEDSSETGAHAPGAGNEASNGTENSGAAYVYTYNGSDWVEEAYIKAAVIDEGDQFGHSVAILGNSLVVGADGEDGNSSGDPNNDGEASAGAAYLFMRDGTTWSQSNYLKAGNAGLGDMFGNAVDLSDDTIVVGADSEDGSTQTINGPDNNDASSAGAAYVFAPPRRVVVVTQ